MADSDEEWLLELLSSHRATSSTEASSGSHECGCSIEDEKIGCATGLQSVPCEPCEQLAESLDDKPLWMDKFEDQIERHENIEWRMRSRSPTRLTALAPTISSHAVIASAVQQQAPRRDAFMEAWSRMRQKSSMGIKVFSWERYSYRPQDIGDVSFRCREQICKLINCEPTINFKIGISRDPQHRFSNTAYGYRKEGCCFMCVLHTTSCDNAIRLEQECIADFEQISRCRNIKAGGDGISKQAEGLVSLYVVFGGAPKPRPGVYKNKFWRFLEPP